jgi:pimeloyl-ACP methyl ester carboxylesterase
MPQITANEITIGYDALGHGEPLVLVHGGWSDRHNWDPVVADLARSHRVIAYDRRGHGRSERPAAPPARTEQEADLAALIEALGCGPAHIAGTSFGASIALGVASRRPDLVRSVVAHEPPLISVVASDPAVAEAQARVGAVLGRVRDGDVVGGARQFVEEVALGPGAWQMMPDPMRATMIDSAPAFVAEQLDPNWASVDVADLRAVACPVLMTQGDHSPPWFRTIVARLVDAIGGARLHTYRGAGHAPHVTHPAAYLEAVGAFLGGAPALAA